ncbi:hypothetical protein, conserved [Plasmodium vivax]|nr:hypothetical protein, conserved [Plasmodium vivax]
MTDDILDITKWGKKYPFLKTVSEVYDEFNNNTYVDTNESSYDALCNIIINNAKGDVEKHNDICKKLMRNLGHLSVNRKDYELSSDRCNILFHWLYNFLDEDKITYGIIDKCFETYDEDRLKKGNNTKKCHYHKNSIFYEPTKITLLDIFNDNMEIIKNILNGQNEESKIPYRKFVCECLKIYNHINETYCLKSSEQGQKKENTCLKLVLFSSSYNIFHKQLVEEDHKIPSLDGAKEEFLDKCSPVTSTVSTALGTVAGASSLLALLYKFSPGGNWIRSGLRGGRGRINSKVYAEGPSELLFNGMENNDFNSYSIGYEAI